MRSCSLLSFLLEPFLFVPLAPRHHGTTHHRMSTHSLHLGVTGFLLSPKLVASVRGKFVVVAIETGGRWSDEAIEVFTPALGHMKSHPSYLIRQVPLAWGRRNKTRPDAHVTFSLFWFACQRLAAAGFQVLFCTTPPRTRAHGNRQTQQEHS